MNTETSDTHPLTNDEPASEKLTNMTLPNAKNVPEPIRILKIETCASLSGRSTLTYHIGCKENGEVSLRVFTNTGKGFFDNHWVSIAAIYQLLEETSKSKPLTSKSLRSLFPGKSVNTAGFVLAVLISERVIQTTPDSLRSYQAVIASPFDEEIKALQETDTSLKPLQIAAPKIVKVAKDKAKVLDVGISTTDLKATTKTGPQGLKKLTQKKG